MEIECQMKAEQCPVTNSRVLHPFFPLWSPIIWDLLSLAFLEETAVVQACGHPEMRISISSLLPPVLLVLMVVTMWFYSHLTLPVCSFQPQHPPLPPVLGQRALYGPFIA